MRTPPGLIAMTAGATVSRAPVLVVGVGSPLRSDDAAGRNVAQQLIAADDGSGGGPGPGTEVLVVHQLAPELAATMAGRRLVVVVDASVEVSDVRVSEVTAGASSATFTHHADLAALVRLTSLLGRPPQRVVTVALPAADLGLGEALSPTAHAAVAEAVAIVRRLCLDVSRAMR